jgi:hypothetical protein
MIYEHPSPTFAKRNETTMTTHLTTVYENKDLSARQVFVGDCPAKVGRGKRLLSSQTH